MFNFKINDVLSAAPSSRLGVSERSLYLSNKEKILPAILQTSYLGTKRDDLYGN